MKHARVATAGLTLLLVCISIRVSIAQTAPVERAASVTVHVDATHPWVDAGITVRKGERVTFAADGAIRWGTQPDQVAGPEGHGAKAGKVGVGGLIGRVGYTGKPFPIGDVRTPLTMPGTGRLFLGINDFVFADNAGSFTVVVSHPAKP